MEINKIYNENCLETLSRMPDGFLDLTVTSPPYDNLRTYNGYSFDFEPIARELFRATKKGGVVVWVVGDATVNGSETGASFRQALYFKEVGFSLHDTMIYKKTGIAYPASNRYYPNFEYMFILSSGRPSSVNLLADRQNRFAGAKKNRPNSGERRRDGSISKFSCDSLGVERRIKPVGIRFNVWEIPHVDSSRSLGHPATFPERLAGDHILTWSNLGDLVYDPFMGSGTTAKMAIVNNRNFIGSEISKEYCEIAEQRLQKVQLAM